MTYLHPKYQLLQIDGVKHVDAAEAFELVQTGNALLIDIREHYEYGEGIPDMMRGMKQLPMSDTSKLLKLPKSGISLIMLCAHGIRSVQWTNWLTQHGWEIVLNLDGGFETWINAGLPVKFPE